MILLVDIGNTRVKWRLIDKGLSCNTSGWSRTCNINDAFIKNTFDSLKVNKIFISNVASDNVCRCFEKYAQSNLIEVKVFKSKSRMLDLKLTYENVESMGSDRSLAMVGAFNGRGILVIDAGSAITADFISSSGEYLGGYIFTGLEMTRNLLDRKTAKVGVVANAGSNQLGLSTGECVDNGVVLMFRSIVFGLIEKARIKEIEEYVVTGGDAELFYCWSDERLTVAENLVLDGLQKYIVEDLKEEGV